MVEVGSFTVVICLIKISLCHVAPVTDEYFTGVAVQRFAETMNRAKFSLIDFLWIIDFSVLKQVFEWSLHFLDKIY